MLSWIIRMINCPKCNKPNSTTAFFCQYCATPIYQSPSYLSKHKGCIIGSFLFFIFIILPIFSIFLFVLIFIIGANNQSSKDNFISGHGSDKVAVINIDGVIMENEPSRGFGVVTEDVFSARRMRIILKEIEEDRNVKGLLLKVNSPGGSSVASEEILQELKDFKKKSGKPIVAYFSDLAASGAYYISMSADKIVANPSNITGSIGVIISYLNFQEIAEKYGVKNIVYKSGPYKDIISEFRKPTEEESVIMQSLISDSYDNFVKAVTEGRRLSETTVRNLADGRVYSAKQAIDKKLIDKIGHMEDAIDETKKLAGLTEATVIEFGKPNFFESLFSSANGKYNLSLLPGVDKYFSQKGGLQVLYLYSPSMY